MLFSVLETFTNGSRLVRFTCGHKLTVGKGITDDRLKERTFCIMCEEIRAHEAGSCLDPQDCMYNDAVAEKHEPAT